MAGFVPPVVWGGELSGDIGDPAPPLQVSEWIKGSPVEVGPGTNIFVVEIWETAIPACRAAIKGLNNIQERFETNGVIVVGLSDEEPQKIKQFMQVVDTSINYRVVADLRKKTVTSYMSPIGQVGLPYTFVIGTNGTVLWRGFSLGGLEIVLQQIIAGKFDVKEFEKRETAHHQMVQYLILAQHGDFRIESAGRLLLANRTNDVPLLCDMAYQISTAPGLKKRDFLLAGSALDQAEQLTATKKADDKAGVMLMRSVWLYESGKENAGMTLATQAMVSAESPLLKTNVQKLLRTMQARLELAATNQVHGASTNTALPVKSASEK